MILGEKLRSLLTGDESVPLDGAALEVAQIEYPMLHPAPWLGVLDRHAQEIDLRAGTGADGATFLQTAHEYLFEELGFRGNQQDYYSPLNSCLNHVLDTRQGIPISLSIVYMEIARRLGREVRGVSLPGHFLMLFRQDAFAVYLDATFHPLLQELDFHQEGFRFDFDDAHRCAGTHHNRPSVTRAKE